MKPNNQFDIAILAIYSCEINNTIKFVQNFNYYLQKSKLLFTKFIK